MLRGAHGIILADEQTADRNETSKCFVNETVAILSLRFGDKHLCPFL